MNCPLCNLVDRLTKYNEKKIPWKSSVSGLNLTGWHYICSKKYDKGFKDVVLYLDDEFVFVQSIRNKSKNREFIVCMPLKHVEKAELRSKKYCELLRKLDEKIIEFISKNFSNVDKNVRVIENFGNLASVPNHAHKQICYSKTNNLYLKHKPITYE
ncbi:MAG: hypothetical protein WC376_02015 [Candidatus Nanoarchaeia archaeon]|jgi:DNA-binding cell septation regulator SpoVG